MNKLIPALVDATTEALGLGRGFERLAKLAAEANALSQQEIEILQDPDVFRSRVDAINDQLLKLAAAGKITEEQFQGAARGAT